MNKKNLKKIASKLAPIACIILLIVVFIKLVIYDCIIGNKLYDDNDIVVRYHRFVNIVTIDNDTDEMIYMHYQKGHANKDANGDKYASRIKYYGGSSDTYEIEPDSKLIEFTSIFDDAYIFTISDEEKDLWESVGFNKLEWF